MQACVLTPVWFCGHTPDAGSRKIEMSAFSGASVPLTGLLMRSELALVRESQLFQLPCGVCFTHLVALCSAATQYCLSRVTSSVGLEPHRTLLEVVLQRQIYSNREETLLSQSAQRWIGRNLTMLATLSSFESLQTIKCLAYLLKGLPLKKTQNNRPPL